MHDFDLLITSDPALEVVQALEDRIYEFNEGATGITGGRWLAILVRDEGDRLIGGLCGSTWGGCLEIRQLWVESSRRRRGLGTRLLGAAEREARRRGCERIVLMTFTFQAPAFYARHGFEIVAVVDDHPHGHQNVLMRKLLVPAAPRGVRACESGR
ncbi:MAG: GNAT family N-acetyltransferase [Vicinamibacterales bacterium]